MERIDTYAGFPIYESQAGYFTVLEGKKSRVFAILEDLLLAINIYLGI